MYIELNTNKAFLLLGNSFVYVVEAGIVDELWCCHSACNSVCTKYSCGSQPCWKSALVAWSEPWQMHKVLVSMVRRWVPQQVTTLNVGSLHQFPKSHSSTSSMPAIFTLQRKIFWEKTWFARSLVDRWHVQSVAHFCNIWWYSMPALTGIEFPTKITVSNCGSSAYRNCKCCGSASIGSYG